MNSRTAHTNPTKEVAMSTITIDQQLAAWRAEFEQALTEWSTWNLRQSVATGWGGSLLVAVRHYGEVERGSAEEAAILAGNGTPVAVSLSEDGRGFDSTTWHQGEQIGVPVYVEKWDADGRKFHGYVDQASRQVVQTG